MNSELLIPISVIALALISLIFGWYALKKIFGFACSLIWRMRPMLGRAGCSFQLHDYKEVGIRIAYDEPRNFYECRYCRQETWK